MDQNRFHEKSYHKAKAVRKLLRHQMFQKNRKTSSLSYLSFYDEETRQVIQQSTQNQLPVSLPPPAQVVRSTISYYRRMGIPIFKTRQYLTQELDPHMTYESLWSLASVEDISKYPNAQQVTKQFQHQLSIYMSSPYKQIRQAAMVAAGNTILGKPQDIIKLAQQDDINLWVLVNHVFESKISYKILFSYLQKNIDIVYRAIYELTNHHKHEIIYEIIQNEQILTTIVNAFSCGNEDVQKLAIRIVGNILGQAQDYAGDITKYHILQKIYPRLMSPIIQNRKDALWLLANYAFEQGGAKEITYKQKFIERILTLFRYEQSRDVKFQAYYLLAHLVLNGDKVQIYKIAIQQRFLQQCSYDLELQDLQITYIALNLVQKLIELGEQYVDHESDNQELNTNVFIREIKNLNLSSVIMSKTYSQNQQISQISIGIMDKVQAEDNQFGRI